MNVLKVFEESFHVHINVHADVHVHRPRSAHITVLAHCTESGALVGLVMVVGVLGRSSGLGAKVGRSRRWRGRRL